MKGQPSSTKFHTEETISLTFGQRLRCAFSHQIISNMSSSRFPCLLWLLIVALSIFLPIAAFPTALSTASVNSSSELLRRECVLDSSAPNGFNCDLNAPTLQQIINKIQDPAYGGKADDTHRACFYTNLGMGHHQWMVGWLKSRGLHHNYYWFSDSVDILCECFRFRICFR